MSTGCYSGMENWKKNGSLVHPVCKAGQIYVRKGAEESQLDAPCVNLERGKSEWMD